jgi:hypothetical protein
MALADLLNLVNEVSVIKTIETNDGMGGSTSTTSTVILSLSAMWTNGQMNRWASDKYAKDSTDSLVFETNEYTFNNISSLTSTQSMIEQVIYNGNTYKTVGFANDIMNLGEITIQLLERIS